MGISGKYTKTKDESNFGERNEANNPHGRCIMIDSEGFGIAYWNNGRFAPGNWIIINSDG